VLAALIAVALLVSLWSFTRLSVAAIEQRFPPVGAFVAIEGLRVHVLDTGGPPNAPALLLLHGASGNLREPVEALREALGGRFRLIAVDRPGHGHTERGGRDMSDPARQADIVAAVLAKLDLQSVIVLGHSWGAAVATALAVQRQDQVAGLILVAPASHPWPGGVSARSRFFALPRVGRALAELVVVPIGLLLVPAAVRALFAPDAAPERYASRIGALLAVRPATFVANSRDVADLYENVVRLSARYDEIAAPTEVITAHTDPIVSPAIHAFGLARDIPDARLTVTSGGGHMLHWTRTAEVVAAIERVLARSEAALRAAE
jgi:pimeloyl-ACP methyl ester carboxylesterase